MNLFDSAVRTTVGTYFGDAVDVAYAHRAVEFVLDVTAGGTDANDTLDVSVQAFVGGQWVDVVHFTQVLGTVPVKRFFAKISAEVAEAMFENGTALAAGSVRNLLSGRYRGKAVTVDPTGNNLTFTFSLTGTPLRVLG